MSRKRCPSERSDIEMFILFFIFNNQHHKNATKFFHTYFSFIELVDNYVYVIMFAY
jgi:hypothetical protein